MNDTNNNQNGSEINPSYQFSKPCTKCGGRMPLDATICPNCGCLSEDQLENPALSVCALVFSLFGGLLGLILAIIGLAKNKKRANRTRCKIAIGIFIAWVFGLIILFTL